MPAGWITLRQTSHADRRLHPIDIEAATLGWMQLVVLAMVSIVFRTLTMYVSLKMNFSSDNRGVKLCPTLIIHANMNNPKGRYPMVTVTGEMIADKLKMISTAGNELICYNSWIAVDELM